MSKAIDALNEKIGHQSVTGTHTFGREEIVAFASKFDPQPFHLDEEAARNSLFGGLCASGWHICSVWMKLRIANRSLLEDLAGPDHGLTYGPSPGIRDLRWHSPVFVDDTITFTTTFTGARLSEKRANWGLLTTSERGEDADGRLVLTMNNAVTLRLG